MMPPTTEFPGGRADVTPPIAGASLVPWMVTVTSWLAVPS